MQTVLETAQHLPYLAHFAQLSFHKTPFSFDSACVHDQSIPYTDMRGVQIFSGNSHPALAEAICERLGTVPARCEVGKFSNGETSVQIGTSVRNQDIFIVQSGSLKINDSIMELLIMINACKGGSAKTITAVMPYYPYSRQSKKKSHRGAITGKLVANLLSIAGVDHVITVDLHASQMQGFFGKPVDNLFAEPLIARWIQQNVRNWRQGVVVSKNAGGSKRVTSLADTLKLNFGIVTTDRMRHRSGGMMDSTLFFESIRTSTVQTTNGLDLDGDWNQSSEPPKILEPARGRQQINGTASHFSQTDAQKQPLPAYQNSPLVQTTRADSKSPEQSPDRLTRVNTITTARRPSELEIDDSGDEERPDERMREIITGRLIHGHLVDDDHPSPALSAMSGSATTFPGDRQLQEAMDNPVFDPMTSSFMSTVSSHHHPDHALGGTADAGPSDDEEEEGLKNDEEQTITLVGHVKDKIAFILDDIIDRSGSWIAAAEVVRKGGAKQVYCIGTHGLFGDDSLEEMENCDAIDYIVVTNSFPIAPYRIRESRKLVVIDLSNLLSEAIRRNHHGGKRYGLITAR